MSTVEKRSLSGENKVAARRWPASPCVLELECLTSFPRESEGYSEDMLLISDLLMLMKKHGFGRVPQVAGWMEELWRDPAKRAEFEERRERHFEAMNFRDAR